MDSVLHYSLARKLDEEVETYQAWDGQRNAMVALRFVPQSIAQEPLFCERFEMYRRRMSGLTQPHVAEFYSLETDGNRSFVVREYVEGQSIKELVEREPFTYDSFLNLASQIARAIQSAHSTGIVHGHLSSHNIIVSPRGQVKIVDFGVAGWPVYDTDATIRTSRLVYLSPEQMDNKPPDDQSDLFSLGVTFYEMLTGQLPFMGESGQEIKESILNDPVDLESEFGNLIPHYARLLLERMLDYDPAERLNGANELRATIDEMLVFQLAGRSKQAPPEKHASPRTYLMLSILTALIVIFWLVISTIRK